MPATRDLCGTQIGGRAPDYDPMPDESSSGGGPDSGAAPPTSSRTSGDRGHRIKIPVLLRNANVALGEHHRLLHPYDLMAEHHDAGGVD